MKHTFDPDVSARHLSEIVRFQTVSDPIEEKIDFAPFFEMHEWLEKTYPNVYRVMEVENFGKAGLLYHWKGTGKSDWEPIMLMAHQDVVPAGDESLWRYPPFSGHIENGRVWSRGADDCKSNMIAELEAMEYLASAGWIPDYDIYLLFGYNEEVGGGNARPTPQIAVDILKEHGTRMGCVLDEGGGRKNGRVEGINADICSFTLGEKGSAEFEITCIGHGGHSSNPPKDTPLVQIARAIIAIEENPLPYRLTETVAERCRNLAPYMRVETEEEKKFAELMREPEKNFEQMIPYLEKQPYLNMICRTSFAVTMAKGSETANMLPTTASCVVNARILPGDTIESVREYLQSIIPEGLEVKCVSGREATPISVYHSKYADALYQTSLNTYPEIVRIPDLLPAGTDSRFMYPICDCVYRFASFYRVDDSSDIHKPNENMRIDILAEGSSFYVDLLTNYYGKD